MKNLKLKKKLVIPVAVIFLLAIAAIWYVNDYYHAEEAVQQYLISNEDVTVTEFSQGLFLDGKGETQAMIFYPGAKVEYSSYTPLLHRLAELGVDCFLVKMPCNLAILGQNKAEDIMAEYDYENWYLAGHSLGGAMAAAFTGEHTDVIDGLVLLAAYPTKSLAESELSVISIYGSEDKVLNRENLEKGRTLMPKNYTELCIEGGNHAWFGNYGEQAGDGVATISREEQQEQTVEEILEIVLQ